MGIDWFAFIGRGSYPVAGTHIWLYIKQQASSLWWYEEACQACAYEMDEGLFELDPTDRYIVSFGAIGYPRSGGPFIRYGIYDTSNTSSEFVRLEGPLLDLW